MADDVEEVLTGLEQRLRELEEELSGAAAPQPRARADAAPPERVVPEPPRVEAPHTEADALDAFGESLRRAARDLVSAYDRALADARGLAPGEALLFRDEVALDVAVDLPGLCTLSNALDAIDGVASVTLRAYAGGQAALDLELDGGVPLVAELRRTLGTPLAVLQARHGRLTVALGDR